jgi:hypothetical protein
MRLCRNPPGEDSEGYEHASREPADLFDAMGVGRQRAERGTEGRQERDPDGSSTTVMRIGAHQSTHKREV